MTDVTDEEGQPEPTIWTLADRLHTLYHIIEEAGPAGYDAWGDVHRLYDMAAAIGRRTDPEMGTCPAFGMPHHHGAHNLCRDWESVEHSGRTETP